MCINNYYNSVNQSFTFYEFCKGMVHIGEKIRLVLEKKKISKAEFARMIDTSRENVYGIFKRESIDTALLEKISAVLEYNFFNLYVIPEMEDNINIVNEPIEYYKKQLKVLEEIAAAQRKIIERAEQEDARKAG